MVEAPAPTLGDRVERAIERPGGIGWGYDFPVQLRWGSYEPGQPNAVGTAFAGHALLDVAENVGESLHGHGAALDAAADDEFRNCLLRREHELGNPRNAMICRFGDGL